MNRLAILLIPRLLSACHAEEVAAAPSGAFSIRQEYKGDAGLDGGDFLGGEFVETIFFRGAKHPVVALVGFPWPGVYSISPDENWILRTQKTGSGDSIAILYRIEKTGRVMEVVGFDEMLWSASDKIARLKRSELYHTGVDDFKWAKDSKRVTITLCGSNVNKSGDGITTVLTYNLNIHAVTPKTEPAGAAQPATHSESKAR